jgi:hypothetical protein
MKGCRRRIGIACRTYDLNVTIIGYRIKPSISPTRSLSISLLTTLFLIADRERASKLRQGQFSVADESVISTSGQHLLEFYAQAELCIGHEAENSAVPSMATSEGTIHADELEIIRR